MNNTQNEYYRKYIKYKKKYLNMKGGNFAFKRGKPFFILYLLNDPQTLKAVSERRSLILNDTGIRFDRPDEHLKLHITLFHFQINMDHPSHKFFYSSDFHNFIRATFNRFLDTKKLIHTRNEYKILNNFYGKEFKLEDQNSITLFRIQIYNYINDNLLKGTRPTEEYKNGFTYLIFKGLPLFAVPEFHWGKGNWLSHISIFQFNNARFQELSLLHKNKNLYDLIECDLDKQNTDNVKSIINLFIGANQNQFLSTMGELNLIGQPRLAVMPFDDIILLSGNPLLISMNRSDPRENWVV